MTSSYNDIYSRFLMKVKDYEFFNYSEADANEYMRGWLLASLSKPYVNRIFESISADEEIAELEYTLQAPVNDFNDKNFVDELLGYQMVCEWLTPQVNTTTLLHQMITNSKESKFFSQQQHIQQMRELLTDSENKVRGMLRDKGYIYNSYLGNV